MTIEGEAHEQSAERLPYEVGGWGCVWTVAFLVIGLAFASSGIFPGEQTSSGRAEGIVWAVEFWQVGARAPVALAMAAAMFFFFVRAVGRHAADYAAEIRDGGLHTHWSALKGPWDWHEIDRISIESEIHTNGLFDWHTANLVVELKSGRLKKIALVSLDEKRQAAFLETSKEMISRSRTPPGNAKADPDV